MNTLILGFVGPWQIIVVVLVVLLLFGGKKIPELMKGIGQGIREFKEGMGGQNKKETDVKKEIEDKKE